MIYLFIFILLFDLEPLIDECGDVMMTFRPNGTLMSWITIDERGKDSSIETLITMRVLIFNRLSLILPSLPSSHLQSKNKHSITINTYKLIRR